MVKHLLEERNSKFTPEQLSTFTDRCIRIIKFWQPIMGLEHWHISCYAGRLEEDKAEVECWPEYREAEMTVNPFRLFHCDDVELEECLVHELGHTYAQALISMWSLVKEDGKQKLEEALVSDVTGAILRAHRTGLRQISL